MAAEIEQTRLEILAEAVFADDGTLDEDEMEALLGAALADGVVDDKERAILRRVFGRASTQFLSTDMRARMTEVMERYRIT